MAVKIVFVAHIVHFFELFDSVEIEVEYGRTCGVGVFVHNGESRRGYHVFDTQSPTHSFDKGCFTGTHLTVESEYFSGTDILDEYSGGLLDLVKTFDDYFHVIVFYGE